VGVPIGVFGVWITAVDAGRAGGGEVVEGTGRDELRVEGDLALIYHGLAAENVAHPFMITEFSYHSDYVLGYDCCMQEQGEVYTPAPQCGGPCDDPELNPDQYQYPEIVDGHAARGTAYARYMNVMASANALVHGNEVHFITGIFWYNALDHPFMSDSRELDDHVTFQNSGEYQALTQNWGMWNPKVTSYGGTSAAYLPLLQEAGDTNCKAQITRTGLGEAWFGGHCPSW